MNPWAWIAAYVVGFALLQLLLVRYLGRDAGDAASTAASESGAGSGQTSSNGISDVVTCSACGAVNERDQGYSFCRECVEPLS